MGKMKKGGITIDMTHQCRFLWNFIWMDFLEEGLNRQHAVLVMWLIRTAFLIIQREYEVKMFEFSSCYENLHLEIVSNNWFLQCGKTICPLEQENCNLICFEFFFMALKLSMKCWCCYVQSYSTLGTFRFDYEEEIQYEYDFSNLQ